MLTNIIAMALASAPLSPLDRTTFDVADAEVARVDTTVHLVTFGSDGYATASLSVWVDDAGHLRLDADFADGLYLTAVVSPDRVTVDSPDVAEAAARVDAIGGWLAEQPPQAGWQEWGACAGHLALAVVECPHPLGVLGCGIGIAGAYCHCGPLINEEIDCP